MKNRLFTSTKTATALLALTAALTVAVAAATGLLFPDGRASGAAPDLTIDSFQYATPDAAQANWVVATAAGKPAVPAIVEQIPCLSLPNAFTAATQRGLWETAVKLDLSAYARIAVRLKSTRPSMSVTLNFQTAGGGWYGTTFNITDKWVNYAFPVDCFSADKNVSGWNQITKVRLSCWQNADSSPATVYVSDLRASNSRNLIANSGFELTTAEAMPDYWGPELAWGSRTEEWVTNMDSWRARWGVNRTASHSGTNSLRIVSSTDSPETAELKAVANWITLHGHTTNTLSVWLKSDQPSLPVTLQVHDRFRSVSKSVFTSATPNSWQRYSFNFDQEKFSDTVSCFIYPTGTGTLWLDDVQLEEGAAATEWRPALTDSYMEAQTVHKTVPPISDFAITPGASTVTVSIDGSARFLVDGQPFIPMAIGWEAGLLSPATIKHLAQAGFNTIAPILRPSLTTNTIRAFLDNAQASGLKVVMWMDQSVSTKTLKSWISSLEDHPAIIMWYVYDEPVTAAQWLDSNEKYHLAKTLDPGRPAMANVTYLPADISKDYASDVLSMDYYPVGAAGSIIDVGSKVETQHQVAVTAGKPTWCWLQSMGYAYFCSREPTGAEAEGMAYLALVHGSRGILYFSHKPRTLEQWNELRLLNSEVRTLTPILCSTNPPPNVSATPDAIHLVGKSHNNQTYVVAVNVLPGTINATLTVADTHAAQATVLFESRNVSVVNGRIKDAFTGYQRHVYALVPPTKLAMP